MKRLIIFAMSGITVTKGNENGDISVRMGRIHPILHICHHVRNSVNRHYTELLEQKEIIVFEREAEQTASLRVSVGEKGTRLTSKQQVKWANKHAAKGHTFTFGDFVLFINDLVFNVSKLQEK